MTVENDGLPLDESAAYDAGHPEVDVPSPAGADSPTEQLPLGRLPDSPTQGSVEGDLFDGIAGR